MQKNGINLQVIGNNNVVIIRSNPPIRPKRCRRPKKQFWLLKFLVGLKEIFLALGLVLKVLLLLHPGNPVHFFLSFFPNV